MIRLKHVYKSFGENQVLKDLNLEIKNEEVFVLLGQSGYGKSVILKHLMGLMKPDSGEVLIDGVDMAQLKGRKLYAKLLDIGMIFQMGALFDSMTVGENVAFYLEEHGIRNGKKINKADIPQLVREALEKVGLKGKEDLYPSDLSGGMRKRASIARTLIYQPKYVFYDEPTTGLDPVTAMTIADLILSQHRELRRTTVVVSHDIVSALRIADRIGLIEKGEIKLVAPPEEFMKFDHPTVRIFNKMIGGDIDGIRHAW
jgi:phospholipid/cholesterol/gamma-HCH transport system ATP-binding protein